eukprot:COSAG02_NODE_42183_length_387_cov_0.538194_1_plen_115_part_01
MEWDDLEGSRGCWQNEELLAAAAKARDSCASQQTERSDKLQHCVALMHCPRANEDLRYHRRRGEVCDEGGDGYKYSIQRHLQQLLTFNIIVFRAHHFKSLHSSVAGPTANPRIKR